MSTRTVLRSLVPALLLGALGAGRAGAQSPQQGSITGRVTDATTGQPIAAAGVNVVGTSLGAQTNDQGQYTIRGVNAGTVALRALRVGFAEQRQSAVVGAGQTATVNFQMRPVAVTLNPVVTTATGQERRTEVGNAIAQVDAVKAVQTTAVANVADLLTARAAGVQVIAGVQTGAGVRVRIRGTSSLSLSNNPIYVVDGVRIDNAGGQSTTGPAATTLDVGGTAPSRVNDLNPSEIESIEVVRGPSAATLYGTDAANGVIVITTKRGVAGRARWTYFTEQGAHVDHNTYPTAYRGWRSGSLPSNAIQCTLPQRAAGSCTQDSVTSYNLQNDPESTPYGTGYRQQHGLQASGGSDAVRFFVHGGWETEDGVLKVPEFEKRYLAAHGLSLLPEQERPSRLDRVTSRGNFNITLSPTADMAVSSGYTSQGLRLPMSDDSGNQGVAGNTYGGPGYKYNTNAAGDTLYGWRAFTPRDIYQATNEQATQRLINAVNANWRPQEWLSFRGNFGLDYSSRRDTQLCRFANCPDVGGDSRLGTKRDYRVNTFVYTADAAGTATHRVSEAVQSKTTAGVQFTRNVFDRNGAWGTQLPPGATTVTAAAVQKGDESTSESRTLGAFVEEHVSIDDRLFVTTAVRSDRNSAFGADFKTVFYPKLAVSWVVSQEPRFPRLGWVDQLRLRTAYGASGVQPGTIDAVQYYSPTSVRGESGDLPGLVFNTLGNRNLKPERSTELELGVDGTFWHNRLSTEITYYNKSSKDALISRILPPSLGTSATSRLENLGEVRNSGWEVLVNAQLLQRDALGWDVTVNGAQNSNELVSLGGVPKIVGSTQQQREGYPLNGWWARRIIGYNDANNDGILTLSEIALTDTAEYLGYSIPRTEIAVTNGFDFWQRRLRLGAMFDYKGGHKIYNNTERIRCSSRANCSGLVNPASSLFEQARALAVRDAVAAGPGLPATTASGYFEDGDFVRFRELNLTFTAPDEWANRFFRGKSLTATIGARNLGIVWTKYHGVDPEAFGTSGDAPSEFQAFGPPTYYSVRFTLGL